MNEGFQTLRGITKSSFSSLRLCDNIKWWICVYEKLLGSVSQLIFYCVIKVYYIGCGYKWQVCIMQNIEKLE